MSIIGKIAKEIGEEVAEGLTKKAAPKVMPDVKKPLEWGFKGRKPTDIEDLDYRDIRFNPNEPKYRSGFDTIDTNKKKLKKGAEKNKYIKELIDDNKIYNDVEPLFKANRKFKILEEEGVPRELTGKMLGNNLGVSYLIRSQINRLIQKRTPAKATEDWKRGWLRYYNELTKSQKETFDSLSNEWNGTVNELVDVAKSL